MAVRFLARRSGRAARASDAVSMDGAPAATTDPAASLLRNDRRDSCFICHLALGNTVKKSGWDRIRARLAVGQPRLRIRGPNAATFGYGTPHYPKPNTFPGFKPPWEISKLLSQNVLLVGNFEGTRIAT